MIELKQTPPHTKKKRAMVLIQSSRSFLLGSVLTQRMSTAAGKMEHLARLIFVRNLDPLATVSEVEGLFENIGRIEKTRQMYDAVSKERGVEITFLSTADAKLALQLHQTPLHATKIVVESAVFASPRAEVPQENASENSGSDSAVACSQLPFNHLVPPEYAMEPSLCEPLVSLSAEAVARLTQSVAKANAYSPEELDAMCRGKTGAQVVAALGESQQRMASNAQRIKELSTELSEMKTLRMTPGAATLPTGVSRRIARTLVIHPLPNGISSREVVVDVVRQYGPVVGAVYAAPTLYIEFLFAKDMIACITSERLSKPTDTDDGSDRAVDFVPSTAWFSAEECHLSAPISSQVDLPTFVAHNLAARKAFEAFDRFVRSVALRP